MGTTRLQLYNAALLDCKERSLPSLTENNKARRALDQVWNGNGVRYCLEQGQWQFAMRTVRLDYDPDITTEFGFTYAFDKPDDWVLTAAVCSDERFYTPLKQHSDETDYWLADITPIYVKYVSDDDNFGNDLSRWPETFTDYVATYFAAQIALDVTGSKEIVDELLHPKTGKLDIALLKAKNRAMMTQPQQRPATGSWIGARRGWGGRGPLGDGGNGGSLTG